MSIEDKAAEIARGLTRAQRKSLRAFSNADRVKRFARAWWAASDSAPTATSQSLTALYDLGVCKAVRVNPTYVYWPPDAYEITPFGRLVASHLKDPRS